MDVTDDTITLYRDGRDEIDAMPVTEFVCIHDAILFLQRLGGRLSRNGIMVHKILFADLESHDLHSCADDLIHTTEWKDTFVGPTDAADKWRAVRREAKVWLEFCEIP